MGNGNINSENLLSLEKYRKYLHDLLNRLKAKRKTIAETTNLQDIKNEIQNNMYKNRISDKMKQEINEDKFEIEELKEFLEEILSEIISRYSSVETLYKYAEIDSNKDKKMGQTSELKEPNKYNYGLEHETSKIHMLNH